MDRLEKAAVWFFAFCICFAIFGLTMTFRQHSGWAKERDECRTAGGVPWQAKHSGGPICLSKDAIKVINK